MQVNQHKKISDCTSRGHILLFKEKVNKIGTVETSKEDMGKYLIF